MSDYASLIRPTTDHPRPPPPTSRGPPGCPGRTRRSGAPTPPRRPPVASRVIAGPRERRRPPVRPPGWTGQHCGIRDAPGGKRRHRVPRVRGEAAGRGRRCTTRWRGERGRAGNLAGGEGARRLPGFGASPAGLGELKHRDQNDHEKKRPPEPNHPARFVRHPRVIRSRRGGRFYTRPGSGRTRNESSPQVARPKDPGACMGVRGPRDLGFALASGARDVP